jgi:hypothetical protein
MVTYNACSDVSHSPVHERRNAISATTGCGRDLNSFWTSHLGWMFLRERRLARIRDSCKSPLVEYHDRRLPRTSSGKLTQLGSDSELCIQISKSFTACRPLAIMPNSQTATSVSKPSCVSTRKQDGTVGLLPMAWLRITRSIPAAGPRDSCCRLIHLAQGSCCASLPNQVCLRSLRRLDYC